MAKDFIGYQALTDAALRGVVREALRRIGKSLIANKVLCHGAARLSVA